MYVERIPEFDPTHPSAGRLGRHIRHDPRSLAYRYPARSTGTLTSVRHQRYIPVLDQGNLGSCTGNAALGAVGTAALFEALAGHSQQPSATDAAVDEQQAVKLYSAATKLDDYPGGYPPTDTGSDGLSVAKAAQRAGLISGYQHATSLESALAALADGPVIAGINWYDSFDQPTSDGFIAITDHASVRGGHEICLDGLDVEKRVIWFTNSWSTAWGFSGRAYMTWNDFGRLLDEKGDVTVFTPATAPPPTPNPAPGDLLGCLGQIAALVHKAQRLAKGK